MRKVNRFTYKFTAVLLVLMMVLGMVPSDVLSGLDFSSIFAPLLALAEEIKDEPVSADKNSNGSKTKYTAPGCSFTDELYDGSDAIEPLPSYDEYKQQTGYTEPLRISLTDFRAQCGDGLTFNTVLANNYMSQGYKLMICDAEELYNYSMIVNGAGSPDEIKFYLSANIVLGNNIEYSEMSYEENFFLPIGNYSNPFTGTFDGQSFEIRDLYIDRSYSAASIGFFGVIGEGALVCNFGLYHPTIRATSNSSTMTAAIVSGNYGTIDSVYVIVQEYRTPGEVSEFNVISTSNALYAGGIAAENYESGIISNSYFAGMLDAYDPAYQHPICARNMGVIENCYYDKEVYPYGQSMGSDGSFSSKEALEEIEGVTGLNNIDIKKVGISANGMQNTKFKANISVYGTVDVTNTLSHYWGYPRLYGFTGTGTEADPYVISTPADLIYFPMSAEYSSTTRRYFQLGSCIDMNEVAPYAYKPNVDFTFYSNYSSGGKWVQFVNKSNGARAFFGVLNGAADGDGSCPICHVHNGGTDANGEPLQECHAILNLTINTPATSVYNANIHYSALIAMADNNGSTVDSTAVKNLNFIGGEISSGSMDCMPSSYNYTAYNVRTATVIANSNYTDLINVHSSATVKAGTGKQYSVILGGLMASGNYRNVTDCTNSGDIIGGYVNMAGENYLDENFRIGGLLGACGSTNSLDQRYMSKLTHVANYGNLYAFAVVADEGSGWTLSGGGSYVCGITHSTLGSSNTGNTYNPMSGQSNYYFDDKSRCDRIANFGMIFDGPIQLDENGDPVFDADGKPQAQPLEAGKELVGNNSPIYPTYMFGIGTNIISHAYNGANIYAVMIEKSHLAGIGDMGSYYSSSLDQYYNFLNYNEGNLYMYAGASEAYGIARWYAYKCCNKGNVYMLGGAVNTRSTYQTTDLCGGLFSGISGLDSMGCYNDGDIYIAPSARSVYNSPAENSGNRVISAAGVSQRFSSDMTETAEDGSSVIIPSINAGTVTIDLDKNNFDPEKNTYDATNINYYTQFFIMGTGLGPYNENYGTLEFVPNPQDKSNMERVQIASCGGLFTNNWNASVSHCRNYADISVDTSNAEGCLRNLTIYALGRNGYSSPNSKCEVSDSINFGDISFKGYLGGDMSVYTLCYWTGVVKNCANLGDVTVDESSVIKGSYYLYDVYSENHYNWEVIDYDSIMLGWYDGCKIPSGLDNDEFKQILSTLDKSKRYGQVNISGKIEGSLYIRPICYNRNDNNIVSRTNIINNGSITVTNAEIGADSNYSGLYIYGLSPYMLDGCYNYAPITVDNVLLHYYAYIYGAAPGTYNINYAEINVTHCLTRTYNRDVTTYVAGIYNGTSATGCENRGNITVKDCSSATVLGTEYETPTIDEIYNSRIYGGAFAVSGIGSYAADSINFADINVSGVNRCWIGGVGYLAGASMLRCYNYGDITCKDSGGQLRIGGVVGYTSGYSVNSCYNFGKVSVIDPNSYQDHSSNSYIPIYYIGGVCGISYNSSANQIAGSVNYGEVVYNNTKGENNDDSYYNTRTTKSNGYLRLCVGGVVGYEQENATVRCSMNYGDVNVLNECNVHVYAGGISGMEAQNTGSAESCNMINYGNITVPDADVDMGQWVMCGGITGGTVNSSGNAKNTKLFKYGINYGTVKSETENAENTNIGAILGRGDTYFYSYVYFVDLSEPPQGSTCYPMLGGAGAQSNSYYNLEGAVNYTNKQSTIDDTTAAVGDKFRTVKLVTLDKKQNGGLFAGDFAFRSNTIHEISVSASNLDNMLMYQDYDMLSPYLQNYMVSRFGDDIKNYGAYVVKTGNRSEDEYIPGTKYDSSASVKPEIPGAPGTFFSTELVDDVELNPVYTEMVKPEERSVYTDYNIYMQQVDQSSLAEIYDVGVTTKYPYANTDTSSFQRFDQYRNLVETRTAYNSKGEVSDTVQYTDINVYVAVDDIDSYKIKVPKTDENGEKVTDENGNTVYEIVDTGGIIYFNQTYNDLEKYGLGASNGSTMQYYQGTKVDVTERLENMDYYTDPYPERWLTCENLETELQKDDEWGADHEWHDTDVDEEEKYWEIAVPYTSEEDKNNMYTKVLGVITSEDRKHKNIVVMHVVIDYYKPYAELSSVTLNLPNSFYTYSNSTATTTTLTSVTEENLPKNNTYYGLLNAVENQPSVTDSIDGEPVNNVTYYYFTDTYATGNDPTPKQITNPTSGEEVENIQGYFYNSNPYITLKTYNLDADGEIYYTVTRQDRIPGRNGEPEKYNDIEWNPKSKNLYSFSGYVNPTNIEYNEETQKSTGTVTINLNPGNSYTGIFYGGYYRVNLFYERTKNSDTYKHFATIYIAKEYSRHNTLSGNYISNFYYSESSPLAWLTYQDTYDSTHGTDAQGRQGGYIAYARNAYNYAGLQTYYVDRNGNDCRPGNIYSNYNYWNGNGLYYALKSYPSKYPSEDSDSDMVDVYIDKDNPIYDPPEEEVTDPGTEGETGEGGTEEETPRGEKMTLGQYYQSVYVYQNEKDGSFYPTSFNGVMDIMAENGDIRRYTVDCVQKGEFGENGEYTKENDPRIVAYSATQGGFPIKADEDGNYKGVISGKETGDVKFTCYWKSSNVTLYHEAYRPGAASGEIYSGDGFSADKIKIYFTPINSDEQVELTREQIEEYFDVAKNKDGNWDWCNTSNGWTFVLRNSAPVGTYKICPYMTYHMDLRKNPQLIEMYDSESKEKITSAEHNQEDNVFSWTIPYEPFIIENLANDESYLTEFDNNNDLYTPFVIENGNVSGKDDRDVYIRSATTNQEIVYVGYDDVMTGSSRVSSFNVYSYVAKDNQNSVLRMKAPYLATVSQWQGTSSPLDETPVGSWVDAEPLDSESKYKEYKFEVEYNEWDNERGDYTYDPSITYYKVTAEDGITSTVYAVYVVPGVRNKETTLEIATENEIPELKIVGNEEAKKEVEELFKESDKIYREVLEKNGSVSATIKEINGIDVDVYQTKIFDGVTDGSSATEPTVYNLKSFVFDISVDLPAGYDYDVLLFSEEKDSYSILGNSQNGFDGKQLIISSSDKQKLNIRIVLKRSTSSEIWGVQYIWNHSTANADENGRIQTTDGGYFYNYVYKRKKE